jgi:hypothetical protein
MEKLIYEAEREWDVAISREQSFIAIQDCKSGTTQRITKIQGKETIVESFLRR